LMCHGRVEFAAIERAHGLRMREAFADELAQLMPMVADGLVTLDDQAIEVTRNGWFVVRAVALVFDRYLKDSASRDRFSKIV
jgi:oxygen-independent coproporphyrinogen-3 oxidase